MPDNDHDHFNEADDHYDEGNVHYHVDEADHDDDESVHDDILNYVDVNNYTNMAALTGPLVSSKATAIGNNLSLKITSPSL